MNEDKKSCIHFNNFVDNSWPDGYSIWLYFGCAQLTDLRKSSGSSSIGKSPYYEADKKFEFISFRLKVNGI